MLIILSRDCGIYRLERINADHRKIGSDRQSSRRLGHGAKRPFIADSLFSDMEDLAVLIQNQMCRLHGRNHVKLPEARDIRGIDILDMLNCIVIISVPVGADRILEEVQRHPDGTIRNTVQPDGKSFPVRGDDRLSDVVILPQRHPDSAGIRPVRIGLQQKTGVGLCNPVKEPLHTRDVKPLPGKLLLPFLCHGKICITEQTRKQIQMSAHPVLFCHRMNHLAEMIVLLIIIGCEHLAERGDAVLGQNLLEILNNLPILIIREGAEHLIRRLIRSRLDQHSTQLSIRKKTDRTALRLHVRRNPAQLKCRTVQPVAVRVRAFQQNRTVRNHRVETFFRRKRRRPPLWKKPSASPNHLFLRVLCRVFSDDPRTVVLGDRIRNLTAHMLAVLHGSGKKMRVRIDESRHHQPVAEIQNLYPIRKRLCVHFVRKRPCFLFIRKHLCFPFIQKRLYVHIIRKNFPDHSILHQNRLRGRQSVMSVVYRRTSDQIFHKLNPFV